MKYRFYRETNQKWWVSDRVDGQTFYTVRKSEAVFYTELDWTQWAEAEGLQREQVPEDQAMRLISAPLLPGLE